jgi:arsenate reductase
MRVLFLCTGNSARSQMAEGLLREAAARAGRAAEVASAGTIPKGLHPLTVTAMAEIGIDISGAESKHLDRFLAKPWDHVITVCDQAQESCPVFPGARHMMHWSFRDPAAATGTDEQRLAAFRAVRDEIRDAVARFLQATPGT